MYVYTHSPTVTLKETDDDNPAASVAVQVQSVEPSGNLLPEVRLLVALQEHTGVRGDVTASDTVGVKVTVAPSLPVASAVTAACVIVGAVVSAVVVDGSAARSGSK
jgi:hypothetical protein